jgi:molybdopterin converting factor small subunit
MAEQLPPNTADPAGRRAGKSRRELFNEQMTTVADLKKKLSKEKDTVDSGLEGMEQTAQPVSEVPK